VVSADGGMVTARACGDRTAVRGPVSLTLTMANEGVLGSLSPNRFRSQLARS
jgi:hypothetical protein